MGEKEGVSPRHFEVVRLDGQRCKDFLHVCPTLPLMRFVCHLDSNEELRGGHRRECNVVIPAGNRVQEQVSALRGNQDGGIENQSGQ